MDYFNSPISVTDASSMLRATPQKNELPYTVRVIKMNNKLVDEWEKKILRKIEDRRGTVPSGKVWPSWQLFKEGKEMIKYSEVSDMIPRASKEQLEFWITFFENSTIEELYEIGIGALGFGWSVIEDEIRLWNADKKWEELFSQTEDPLEWEKKSPSHQALLRGDLFPFWDKKKLQTIGEKVGTIFNLQITPTEFRQKITYNMRPFTKVVARLNNDLVSEWEKEVLGEVTKREDIDKEEFARWSLWFEGKGVKKYEEMKDKFPLPSEEQLEFWKDLLEKSSLEELHAYGLGVVHYAHKIIQNAIRTYITDQKLEKIYQGSTFEDWEKNAEKEKDLVSGKILPFWDKDTLLKVSMKVGTILSVQVNPNN